MSSYSRLVKDILLYRQFKELKNKTSNIKDNACCPSATVLQDSDYPGLPLEKSNLVKRRCLCYKLEKQINKKGLGLMSKNTPECPLSNPLNCKEYNNPKLCALARGDRTCRKKNRQNSARQEHKRNQPAN